MSISEYKGKISIRERGWALLPVDLLQYIATIGLVLVNSHYVQPSTSCLPWQSRTVLFALRDAAEMDRLMNVCVGWKSALESHQFWQHAVASIDPFDSLGHHTIVHPPIPLHNNSSAAPIPPKRIRILPWKHFRNLVRCSCIPCRVTHPHNNTGLAAARQAHFYGHHFGVGGICPAHAETHPFCNICFRESAVSISNDRESFPAPPNSAPLNVCKMCRRLVRNWQELCVDEEARRAIDGFVVYGEGTARRTAEYCLDRAWLRRRTRIADFTDMVRANNDVFKQSRAYDSDDEIMDSDEEDDEESADVGGRSMALVDWARDRVLRGFWMLPTDQWVAQMHPITLQRSRPVDFGDPLPSVSDMDPPPGWSLCEMADYAFRDQLGPILTPPFENILRKLISEGGGSKEAQRLNLRKLGVLLHDETTWREGLHYSRRPTVSDDDSDDSCPSTTSASSTSPVLSTSTLQTTPSPPPTKLMDDDDSLESVATARVVRGPPIPAASSRQYIRMPWIPDNLEDLSEGSQKEIMRIWRNVCEPLYACDCQLCERIRPKEKPEAETPATIAMVPSQDQLAGTYVLKDEGEEQDGDGELEYEEEEELYSTDGSMLDYMGDMPVDIRRKRSGDEIDVDMEATQKRRRALSPEPEWTEPTLTKASSLSPARKRSSEEVEQLEQSDGTKRLKRAAVDVV